MKRISLCALAAAGLFAFTAGAHDEKTADTQTQTSESSTTTKQIHHGKKKASKSQQLSRGAGPVGDEGSKSSKSTMSTTSPDTSDGASVTTRKTTKKTQIKRGAGPEGTEGATTEKSSDTSKTTAPAKDATSADQPKQ